MAELSDKERAILEAVALLGQGRERVKVAAADLATAKAMYQEAQRRLHQAEAEHAAEQERFLGLVGEGS